MALSTQRIRAKPVEISVHFRYSTHDFQKLRKETSEIEALSEGL